jgi:hypothetical protein
MSEKVRMGLILLVLLLVGGMLRILQGQFATVPITPEESTRSETPEMIIAETIEPEPEPAVEEPIEVVAPAESGRGEVGGRVYDADTEKGLNRQTVYASPKAIPGSKRAEVLTDGSGHYQFNELLEGNWEIWLDDVEGYRSRIGRQDKLVAVSNERPLDGIDFSISQGITIRGRVVREDGELVNGVRVYGTVANTSISDSKTTNKKGEFILAGFDPHCQVTVGVAGGTYLFEKETLYIEEESLENVELILMAPATISGVLLNADELPFPERNLYMVPYSQLAGMKSAQSARKTAAFRFDYVMAGTYSIYLSQHAVKDTAVDALLGTFTVESGQHLKKVELIVTQTMETQLAISGRITDDGNNPINDVEVKAVHRGSDFHEYGPVASNEEGTFAFPATKEGLYVLTFSAEGYVSKNLDLIDAGTMAADVVLEREGHVAGRVIDGATHKPVPEFQLRLTNGDIDMYDAGFRTYRDDDGRFEVGGARADKNVTLSVRADGYAERMVTVSNIVRGETVDDIVIELESPNTIRGEVVDSNGRPVADASATLGDAAKLATGLTTRSGVLTNAEGVFELKNVGKGTHSFRVRKNGFQPHIETVSVNRPETLVRVTLNEGASLTVSVTHDGEPTTGLDVHGYSRDELAGGQIKNNFSGQTDSEGLITFRGLYVGSVNVSVNYQIGEAHGQLSKSVEIAYGSPAEVEFTIKSSTSSIEGFLMSDANTTMAGGVNLREAGTASDNFRSMRTPSSGKYRFESVEPGTYVLSGATSGMRPQTKQIQIQVAEDDQLNVDIILGSGADLLCEITNVPAGMDTGVVLYGGNVEIAANFTIEDHNRLYTSAVAMSTIENGMAFLKDIEPGSYTLVAFVATRNAEDQFVIPHFVRKSVTIRNYSEHRIRMSL